MSKRRPAIGPVDYLAVMTGEAPAPSAKTKPAATRRAPSKRTRDGAGPISRRASTPAKPAPGRAVRVTFHVEAELVDEARNAVVALAGHPVRLTLARLVNAALRRELARLQREHHNGKPWPRRAGELIGGRPIGS